MASLTDRQYQSHRRVRPGRLTVDEAGAVKHEEHAVAVVGIEGEPIADQLDRKLDELLAEARRTNRLLELLIEEEVRPEDAT